MHFGGGLQRKPNCSFYFAAAVCNGGGEEGERLKMKAKPPPTAPLHIPAGKVRALTLLQFERALPNIPFPFFVSLGARASQGNIIYLFLGTFLPFLHGASFEAYDSCYERNNITFAASSFQVSF